MEHRFRGSADEDKQIQSKTRAKGSDGASRKSKPVACAKRGGCLSSKSVTRRCLPSKSVCRLDCLPADVIAIMARHSFVALGRCVMANAIALPAAADTLVVGFAALPDRRCAVGATFRAPLRTTFRAQLRTTFRARLRTTFRARLHKRHGGAARRAVWLRPTAAPGWRLTCRRPVKHASTGDFARNAIANECQCSLLRKCLAFRRMADSRRSNPVRAAGSARGSRYGRSGGIRRQLPDRRLPPNSTPLIAARRTIVADNRACSAAPF